MFPHESIKLISINGIAPTSANIADHSYSLTTEVYAVIREFEGSSLPAHTFSKNDWRIRFIQKCISPRLEGLSQRSLVQVTP